MTDSKSWYVVYTKSRTEKRVYERLLEENVDAFFPTIDSMRQWSDRRKLVKVPLFTSYIFVNISMKEYSKVRQVFGVVNFIYYRFKPAKIREKEILAIKEFLKKSDPETIEFMPNDYVSINTGLLVGKKGRIVKVGKNKIILHIEELGTVIKAEISKSMLQKV